LSLPFKPVSSLTRYRPFNIVTIFNQSTVRQRIARSRSSPDTAPREHATPAHPPIPTILPT
jgi:hypothetical protein